MLKWKIIKQKERVLFYPLERLFLSTFTVSDILCSLYLLKKLLETCLSLILTDVMLFIMIIILTKSLFKGALLHILSAEACSSFFLIYKLYQLISIPAYIIFTAEEALYNIAPEALVKDVLKKRSQVLFYFLPFFVYLYVWFNVPRFCFDLSYF